MIYLAGAEPASGVAFLDFKIMPSGIAAALAEVWQTALSAEATYTTTRARTVTTLPVVGVEVSEDILTVTIDGANLSPEFYAGTKKAAVALVISDGNNERTSDYIPIVPQATLTDLTLSMQADCSILVTGTVAPELQEGPAALRFYYSPTETTAKGLISNGEFIVLPIDNMRRISATLSDLEIRNYQGVAELTVGSKKLPGVEVAFNNIPEPVDMGLSVKWASFNVGAGHPGETGDFYAWGETTEKSTYSDENYIFSTPSGYNKYYYGFSEDGIFRADGRTVLEPEDDVAVQNLGDKWRIPTIDEINELKDENKCTWEWINQKGMDGYLVTSKITRNSIFIPAIGSKGASGEATLGLEGLYWSSSRRKEDSSLAWVLLFYSDYIHSGYNNFRSYGQQVRPVYGEWIHVENVELSRHAATIDIGSEICLKASIIPSNAFETGIRYNSSNSNVAHVNEQGVITPIGIGEAIITVVSTDGGHTDQCVVTVSESLDPHPVDMGLPSGLKWASWNLGASRPENNGRYYAWGEIETKDYYAWSTYKWWQGADWFITKYCTNSSYGEIDNKTVLEITDDAAAVNLGDKWRIPTDEEWTELRSADNCTWVYTTVNEVNGYLVTSNANGNSIFLPSAGYKGENGHLYDGERGRYWAATINTENNEGHARSVNFDSNKVSRSSYYRYFGRSIRPVCY